MAKLIDLTGQKFGKLTVIKRSQNKGREVCWQCQCDCGTTCIVTRRDLQTGHTKSCGCFKKERVIKYNKNEKISDLSGQTFGHLTALYPLNDRKYGKVIWMCSCDCGKKHKVIGSLLKQGLIQSCGHEKSRGETVIKKILDQYQIPYEIEKTFETCRFPDTKALGYFDFYISDKYLIEFDGIQHFQETGWNQLQYTKEHDNYKNQWCKMNNIPLIRIPYTQLQNLCLKDLLLETSNFIV